MGGHVFYLVGSVWTDRSFQSADKEKIIKVTAFSDEYFRLLKEKPELSKFFALGPRVLVKLDDFVCEVVE